MSEIAGFVGQVAGIASAALTVIPGGAPFAAAASAIAAGASAIAQLTAKPPASTAPPREFVTGVDQPLQMVLGRMMTRGNQIHEEAGGPTIDDIPNPWLHQTFVLSACGPVEAVEAIYANDNPTTWDRTPNRGGHESHFEDYARADWHTGGTGATLDPFQWEGPGKRTNLDIWQLGWRTSGLSALQVSQRLDDKETHFRNGPADWSAILKGVRAYDPRHDSTYPGGSGPRRIGQESTYTYSVNGPIQALTYAFGRYRNGHLIMGGGLSLDAIDVASFVEAANVADANGWECHGVVLENGEDTEIWNNLKLMLETASAWPSNIGGVLTCIQRRPVVPVTTITDGDLEGECTAQGLKPWRDGLNTVIPKFTDEASVWEPVAGDAVEVPHLRALHGEVRSKEIPFKLVAKAKQAAELSVLRIYDTVELDPIKLKVGRRFLELKAGDGVTLDLPSLGLSGDAVILSHHIDPMTGQVTLGLKTDTTAKHAYAKGQTSAPPPPPRLASLAEMQQAHRATLAIRDERTTRQAIATSYTKGLSITATDAGSEATVTVSEHVREYGDARPAVTIAEATITAQPYSTTLHIFYDDADTDGVGVTMEATETAADAYVSADHPHRHYVGTIRTPAAGGADTTGGGARPSGSAGDTGGSDGDTGGGPGPGTNYP